MQKSLNLRDILFYIIGVALLIGSFAFGVYLLPNQTKLFLQTNKDFLALSMPIEQLCYILPLLFLLKIKKLSPFHTHIGLKPRPLKETLLLAFSALFISWCILILLQVIVTYSGIPIPGLSGQQENIYETFGVQSWGIIFIILSGGVIAPIIEEIIFRGFIQEVLSKKMPLFLAAFLSAVLFAAVHGQFQVFIPLFVLGSILSYLYAKTGSVYAGILFHLLNNCIALTVTYFFRG